MKLRLPDENGTPDLLIKPIPRTRDYVGVCGGAK